MEGVNDIGKELKGLNSPLADMSRNMPYEVPEGYFESFSESVGLLKAGKQMPYELPAGYFDTLADDIYGIVRVGEVYKENSFNVPSGYFDKLPQEILAKAKLSDNKPHTKSISIRIWKNVRWAAAALLILGIGTGVYRNYTSKPVYNVANELSVIPPEAISEYIEQNIDEFDVETIAANVEPNDVKSVTDKLTNDEIEKYLNDTGWE